MTDHRKARRTFDAMSLSAGDGIMQADGTIWSHAATLGSRVYAGEEFTIDQATVENFVRVFTTGSPAKVPVDYEHASTTDDEAVRRMRAQGQVPKAGDVLEMCGVFAPGDFAGALKAAAEKLCADAGRPLDDPKNLGLWMRWKPTSRALSAIKAREYTELSITFYHDMPNNSTGASQGPTIIAVALTNLPFLDDMLPVAASRSGDPHAADPRPDSPERETMKLTVLSVAAAILGKAVASDEEALTELQGLQPEIKMLREYRTVIGAEIGETDPVKAAAKIRELKTAVETATAAAAEQKKTAIKTQVETTMKEYEKRLTVPLKELMGRGLTKELEDGKKLDETETLKALKSLPTTGITTQRSQADAGGESLSEDVRIDATAKELMQSNAELKELAAKPGMYAKAFTRAMRLAAKQLGLDEESQKKKA